MRFDFALSKSHFRPERSDDRFFATNKVEGRSAQRGKNRYNCQMQTLSPSAQKIQNILNSLGYDYTVIEHAESTRTAVEAAQRAGCELGQIVKSLIFKGRESGKPIIVLTSGANRVDEKRIREYAGEGIGKADADFVRAVTGFAIGGVPPVGHLQKIETYMDEDFLGYETVWAAAGTPNAIFELKTSELQKMTGAQIVRVK
jgi:prolyl-tRNA editing enzyme YbaK/EbsC (Cys-tRNA(Pro) deacylase)